MSLTEIWLLTLIGLFEFFWSEIPFNMRSLGPRLSLLAISEGFYQSGVLVVGVNSITKEVQWRVDCRQQSKQESLELLLVSDGGQL